MRLAIVKKGEAPNPTGSKTHISSTLPPAPRTRHFCNSRNPGAGRNATRTSTAHQPCKGSKGRKPTTPNLPKRSQRISAPFKKGEGGRGQKKDKTQLSKTPWRRITQPPSNVAQVHEQPHLAELTHSNKMVTRTSNRLEQVIASKSRFVVRSRTHPRWERGLVFLPTPTNREHRYTFREVGKQQMKRKKHNSNAQRKIVRDHNGYTAVIESRRCAMVCE